MTFLRLIDSMYSMKILIRDLPSDVHKAFKILCVKEELSMNKKLLRMIREEVKQKEGFGFREKLAK